VRLVLTHIALFVVTLTFAQDATQSITLDEVMKRAGAESGVVKEFQALYEVAKAEQQVAGQWWIPDLYLGVRYHQLDGAAMNGNGEFFRNVDRENFWAGAGLNVQWDLAQGIYGSKSADLGSESMMFRAQDQKNRAVLSAVEAYLDLSSAQSRVALLEDMEDESGKLLEQIRLQHEGGFLYESEYLLAKANHNRNKLNLRQAEKEMAQASDELIFLIHHDAQTLRASDEVLAEVEFVTDLSADASAEIHPLKKSMLAQYESAKAEKDEKTKGLLLPTVGIGNHNGLFGEPVTDLDFTYAINAAITWRIPLADLFGSGEAKVHQQRMALCDVYMENFNFETKRAMNSARNVWRFSRDQLKLARESMDLTREAWLQSIQRQQLRTAEPYEVYQAQQFYMQSQIDYYQAVVDFNSAQYRYYVAVGNSF